MEELLKQYGIPSLENEKEMWGDNAQTECAWWYQVLEQTDYIPNKIIESLIENLADATALNFITVFIKFLADVGIHYSDVLKLRKKAREEINRLGGETTEGETE